MKNFKIAVSSVACAMLVGSVSAQQEKQDGDQSKSDQSQSDQIKSERSTELGSPKERATFGKDSVLSPTGRMTGHSLRASKLTGADVKDSQGQSVGRIEDAIINPASGRIEFAVISLSGGSVQTTATTPGAATATSGKLVPVPWTFLRSGSTASATPSATTSISGTEMQTFTLNVDRNKLQQAPSFDRNNWPDLAQAEWHQRISSHYGRPGATGGAESPSGQGSSFESKDKEDSDRTSSPEAPKAPEKR